MTWEKLDTAGPKPPVSEDHTAIYDPLSHRLILYGGENGPTTNKLWTLDLKTLTWRNLTTSEVPRRESHSAVYDSRGRRMVVFGGVDRAPPTIFTRFGPWTSMRTIDDAVSPLRAEFLEMPGMRLTAEQVQRLCGLERTVCQVGLEALVDAQFLRVNGEPDVDSETLRHDHQPFVVSEVQPQLQQP